MKIRANGTGRKRKKRRKDHDEKKRRKSRRIDRLKEEVMLMRE